MTDDSIQIEDVISSVQDQILHGLHPDFTLNGSIEMEVSVSKAMSVDGKVKLFVFQAGGDYDKESIAKIKFKIRPKMERDGLGSRVKNSILRDAYVPNPKE